MKQDQKKEYVDLEDYDSSVSLWQMVPAGQGKGLGKLQLIVDAVHSGHIGHSSKPLSILIAGEAKKTHSRAFLRALGAVDIAELPAYLLTLRFGLSDFVASQESFDGLLLTGIEQTAVYYMRCLYQYLKEGRYLIKNLSKLDETPFPFDIVSGQCPIVLTTSDINVIPAFVKQTIDFVVTIEPYTEEQIKQILVQRIKYLGTIEYEGQALIDKLVEIGKGKLDKSIALLKDSLLAMHAEGKTLLTLKHVERAIKLL
jgi:hypothetical protein